MKTVGFWIQRCHLSPHPEGGFYRETYRSEESLSQSSLPPRFSGGRVFSTSMIFLLPGNTFSSLHRLQSDEVWHFHDGAPLDIFIISPGGILTEVCLGIEDDPKQVMQTVVKAGNWFGAKSQSVSSYSLVGCTVSPGFEFQDFELARRDSLVKEFPHLKDVIHGLTRS